MLKLDDKSLIFLGDFHGRWNDIWNLIFHKNITNCNLICVGDVGLGFESSSSQTNTLNKYNNYFKSQDINFYSIRGNHDDPKFFKGEGRVCLSNLELVEDYTIATWKAQTIQFIGGAISIDRKGRIDGRSYWKGEVVDYKPEKLQKVDILVTHTCPSWCFPQQFGEIVYGWAQEDITLLQDLRAERQLINMIFNVCKPSVHLYGHFHDSRIEEIDSCKHKLLNINEFWELK